MQSSESLMLFILANVPHKSKSWRLEKSHHYYFFIRLRLSVTVVGNFSISMG